MALYYNDEYKFQEEISIFIRKHFYTILDHCICPNCGHIGDFEVIQDPRNRRESLVKCTKNGCMNGRSTWTIREFFGKSVGRANQAVVRALMIAYEKQHSD